MKHHLIAGAASVALLAACGTAQAAEAEAATTVSAEAEVEAIVVYGQGQSRQVQTMTQEQLTLEAAGTSPLKAIDKLPGVTFQSADAFGAYEWSTRISIRGFDQNRLGFTLDGVPLGDMTYGNHNGLHVSRAAINENIGRVELAQGAGSLSTASTSNLGGTLQFFTRDPSEDFHVQTDVTYGSENTLRGFARLDTGALEALGGLRGYVSVVKQTADKWKGGGEQKQFQYDIKAVLPIGDDGSLTAFFNHSERREQDYQDMSFDMIKRLGRDWDNTKPNWKLAIDAAQAYNTGRPLPAPFATVDDAYYAGAGVRDDSLYGITLDMPLAEGLRLQATAYGHKNEGQGLWYTPYVTSPGWGTVGSTAAPLSIRTTEYDIDRKGLIGGLTLELGDHRVSGGFWVESNDFHQARRFYAETAAAPSRNSLDFQSNPFFTQWEYDFNTETRQLYLQDVWSPTEALKINFGFKSVQVRNSVSRIAGNPLKATLESEDWFLPQIGVVYRFDDGLEVFGGYTENMAAFVSAATAGPFSSQSQTVVDYIAKNLKAETSKTFEAGVRYHNSRFQGVAAVYHVTFDNRLGAASSAPPILGLPSVLSNVGSVETKGVELAGEFRIADDWSLYGSYAYNDSQYQDDVVSANGTVEMRTAGKEVVFTPKNLAKLELRYDNGGLYGRLGVGFTDERWYTFENLGGQVDGYVLTDLTVGYRFEDASSPWLRGLEVQANVTNLMDEDYISTVGSGGAAKSDVAGTAMTLLPGAPRQAFVTIRKQF
ncbi:TonB-dependent receptor [Caulobacter mirabilis]|uniref:TonB-dependent receptor n=1 Tax=Caulobacter mirabilis TaxID=69666 RepID=A0A2D2AVZ0_9CAUL|nr:TonB-dependent receptor [Caulobacter mirabilis]ATQ42179.1 TonB-dependent receptor [Caulobacter mirabilis]